jgi:hypothetical protein
MGLVYKFQDGEKDFEGSTTKKMVNKNKPKEALGKPTNINRSESTLVSKPIVKDLRTLWLEKIARENKSQPVISQGKKLTEQEQQTSDKINKRLDNKAKYKNEPGIINDFLNVTGIDPDDIGMTAGNIASKLTRLRPLSEKEIIMTTDNPKNASKLASEIALQAAANEIAGGLLRKPVGVAWSAAANKINNFTSPVIQSLKNASLFPANSRLIYPGLLNRYPRVAGEIAGNIVVPDELAANIVGNQSLLNEGVNNSFKVVSPAEKKALVDKYLSDKNVDVNYLTKKANELDLNNIDIDRLKILSQYGKQKKITKPELVTERQAVLDEYLKNLSNFNNIYDAKILSDLDVSDGYGLNLYSMAEPFLKKENVSLEELKERAKELELGQKLGLDYITTHYNRGATKDLARSYKERDQQLFDTNLENYAKEMEDIQLTPEEFRKNASAEDWKIFKENFQKPYKGINAFQSVRLNKKGGILYKK